MKKLLVFLLAVAMLLTCCACKGNPSALEGNTYVEGFPIVKDRETIEVLTFNIVQHGDFDEMGFTKYYEELTNMDIKWQIISPDAIDSKLTLMFQSNELPDVISLPRNGVGSERMLEYTKTGQIIQLDELIDKYAPNIKAMFEKYPEIKKASTAVDGKIYSLPTANMATKNHERFPQKLYIRKSWLDNLDLKVPTTAEEFYNVLMAFKTNDPNGNGEADEIPFATNGLVPSYFGSWGSSFNFNNELLAVDDNGKITYGYANEGAKQAVSFFNRIYTLGLCEYYATANQWQTKLKNGVVGVFYNEADFIVGDELAEDYIMIAPFAGSSNVKPVMSVSGDVSPNHLVITSACKNPIAAIRWVDYLYSAEGYYLVTYGRDGDVITKNKDGKWDWVEGVTDNSSVRFKHTPGYVLPTYFDDEISDMFYVEEDESKMTQIEKQDNQLNKDVTETYLGKYEPKNLIWMPAMDEQALKVINQYFDNIESYASESIYEFCVGNRNIDTEWDAYVAELNKKGLNLVLAEYQRLYDNAQAQG